MRGPARLHTVLVAALVLVLVSACKSLTPPPYRAGAAPSAETLIAATTPRIDAIQVPSARVKTNRAARGGLSFIAQAPSRFNGRVHAAGNELVTLAFHEDGYALRYLMDGMPQGYYAGPPSACAVEALLGVEFSLDGLVALVLGGGPVIAGPREVVRQRWDRRAAREVLVLRIARTVQELYFVPRGHAWWFAGASVWARSGDDHGAWLWTVEHLELHARGDAVLPRRTRIATPGKRRDQVVVITYREQNTDPEFARAKPASPGEATDPEPEPEEWGDDEGWEDLEEGADAQQPAAGEPAPTEPPAPEQDTTPPPATAAPKIPPQFQLSPAGLAERGDLCRR